MIWKGKERKLILSSGCEYIGYGFGADEGNRVAELVFNTSPVGYQEILSDPSYTDQFVVMAYPLIGNYGINDDDFETARPTIGGFVVRDYNDMPSNFRSRRTLGETMRELGIPGITGVDTREIVRKIRREGTMKALLTDAEMSLSEGLEILGETNIPHDAVSRVSRAHRENFISMNAKYHIDGVSVERICGGSHERAAGRALPLQRARRPKGCPGGSRTGEAHARAMSDLRDLPRPPDHLARLRRRDL